MRSPILRRELADNRRTALEAGLRLHGASVRRRCQIVLASALGDGAARRHWHRRLSVVLTAALGVNILLPQPMSDKFVCRMTGALWRGALILLICSAAVHAETFIDPAAVLHAPAVWLLHVGVFACVLPLIGLARVADVRFTWAVIRQQTPRPLLWITALLAAYGAATFWLAQSITGGAAAEIRGGAFVLVSHGKVLRELSGEDYQLALILPLRMTSALWMSSFAAIATTGYTLCQSIDPDRLRDTIQVAPAPDNRPWLTNVIPDSPRLRLWAKVMSAALSPAMAIIGPRLGTNGTRAFSTGAVLSSLAIGILFGAVTYIRSRVGEDSFLGDVARTLSHGSETTEELEAEREYLAGPKLDHSDAEAIRARVRAAMLQKSASAPPDKPASG